MYSSVRQGAKLHTKRLYNIMPFDAMARAAHDIIRLCLKITYLVFFSPLLF